MKRGEVFSKKEEIELLPPNPRFKCEKCGRKFSKLKINKRTGMAVCGTCNKTLGTNIFYNPQVKLPKKDFVGKYNMSNTEKLILKHKGVKNEQNVSNWLNNLRNKKNAENKLEIQKEQQNKEMNRKLLEGLGLA